MALPVVVVENAVADELVARVKKYAEGMKLGPAYDKATELGPMINAGHREFVLGWIEKGIQEGAKLVLDGRGTKAPEGYEKGFYLGPTIFDGVTEEMEIGREEIFGPVLCIKRVENYEEGIAIMNASCFANGSVIFTESGAYAPLREGDGRRDGRRERRDPGPARASSASRATSSRSSAISTAWGATASSSSPRARTSRRPGSQGRPSRRDRPGTGR